MRALVFGLGSLVVFSSVFALGASAECSPTDLSSAEQSYSTARALGDAGQWEDAIPSLERALEFCPEHEASLQLLAFARMQAKQYGPAAESFQKLIEMKYEGEIGSADLNTLRAYGFVLLNLNNWSGAERVYRAVLAQDPMNKEAHERLVYAYDKSGNTAMGISHLEALYNLSEGEEASKHAKRIGAAYKKVGEEASAKEWYALAGGGASGQFAFGLDHMERQEWAKAAESFESYLQGQPESVSAMKNLGICYDRLGRKADAAEVFARGLEVDPERRDIATSLALAYSDLEKWSDVAAVAGPAVENWSANEPGKGAMFYLMGKVYEKRDGDYESAIRMFEQARSDPAWGSFAVREIDRQEQLIAIRDARKG
jgi:tetratricopeptide (TPR) repeat protein